MWKSLNELLNALPEAWRERMAVTVAAFCYVGAIFVLSPYGNLATFSAMVVFGLVFTGLVARGFK